MKRKDKKPFNFPRKEFPLHRIRIPETGDTAELYRIYYDDFAVKSNTHITECYMNYYYIVSRDWHSICFEDLLNGYSTEMYYGSEVQKMLNVKNRV